MNANFEYLCYGLMAAWLIVTFYVILLGLRESKLRRELDRVRQMVEPPSRRRDETQKSEAGHHNQDDSRGSTLSLRHKYLAAARQLLRHVRKDVTHHRHRRDTFTEIVEIHFIQRVRLRVMPIEIVQPHGPLT